MYHLFAGAVIRSMLLLPATDSSNIYINTAAPILMVRLMSVGIYFYLALFFLEVNEKNLLSSALISWKKVAKLKNIKNLNEPKPRGIKPICPGL